MTLIVTLKPPGGGSDINLHAKRIDYTINNDILQKRTGTEDGRAAQLISGLIQINITGVCIEENGYTTQENMDFIEDAINDWGDVSSPGDQTTYPKINWRLGDEYMLIQKLAIIDEAWMDNNEINYLLTVYIDTRT